MAGERRGIYVASKTRHASLWRDYRDAGFPIISTWIDEAGVGESASLSDLWERCIAESSNCARLIIFRERNDVLKGAWIELGCALTSQIPVYAVGLREFTVAHHPGISHFSEIDDAMKLAALSLTDCTTSTTEGNNGG